MTRKRNSNRRSGGNGGANRPQVNRITFRSLHVDLDNPESPFKKNGGKELEVDREKLEGILANWNLLLEHMQKEDSGEVEKKLPI